MAHLLKNRCYLGEVIHKGRYYPGEHEPIVPHETFDAVQAALASKAPHRPYPDANRDSLLKGLLFDARGHCMTPTSSHSKGPLYRYYTSRPAIDGRKAEAPQRCRVSAPLIEAKVLKAIGWDQAEAGQGSSMVASNVADAAERQGSPDNSPETLRARLLAHVERVMVLADAVRIVLRPGPDREARPELLVPWASHRAPTKRLIDEPGGRTGGVPIRSEQRARLVQGIANARAWLDELVDGSVPDLETLATRERCSVRHIRMVLNLAFLRPAVVQAAVAGTLPRTCGVVSLSDPPLVWREPA